MVEMRQVEKHVSAKKLNTATYVGRDIPDEPSVGNVRQLRGHPLDPGVSSILPPSDNQRGGGASSLHRKEEGGNVAGIVLPVPIKRHDPLPSCCAHAGDDGCALSPGSFVPDDPDTRKTPLQRLQSVRCSVNTPVVDADHLELAAFQDSVYGHHEWLDIAALVSDRNDDGNHGQECMPTF